jgi:hypothetical protein
MNDRMTRNQLDIAMQKLLDLSKTSLTNDFATSDLKRKSYVYALSNMSYEMFEKAVVKHDQKSRYFPEPSDLNKAYHEIKKEENAKLQEMEFTQDCVLCENRGIFFYNKQQNGISCQYAARCICERGNKYICVPRVDYIFSISALISETEKIQKPPDDAGDSWEPKKIFIQDILNSKTLTQRDDVPVFG